MMNETKSKHEFAFGKRFRALDKQVAELREYLNLPPATDNADEPDRSTLFVIADISEREEPRPERDTFIGFVLHVTTNPHIAHELFRTESARAPEQIGLYVYRRFDTADLMTVSDPSDPMIAKIYIYPSGKADWYRPITMKAPHHDPPQNPAKNEILSEES